MSVRSRHLRGFLLAEALVSVSVAALTAAAAMQSYIWCVHTTADARSDLIASEILQREYETARLLNADELASVAAGSYGGFNWRRQPQVQSESAGPGAAAKVRISVDWITRQRPRTRTLDVVIWPASTGAQQ